MIIEKPDSDYSMIVVDTDNNFKDSHGRGAGRGELAFSLILPNEKIKRMIPLLKQNDINLSMVLSDIKSYIDPEASENNKIIQDINRVRIYKTNFDDFNLQSPGSIHAATQLTQKMKVLN